MRKRILIITLVALASVWAVAQGQDDSAKQNIQNAGNDVKHAAVNTGRAIKNGTVAAKNKVVGDDKDTPRGEALENSVQIVSGPTVAPAARSASISWSTNKAAATDVWLTGAGIRGHRTKYVRGGARQHQVVFTNLKPNTTYTYAIRTREGEDRKEGQFTTTAR